MWQITFCVLLTASQLEPVLPFSLEVQDWVSLHAERANILSTTRQLITSSTLSWVGIRDVQSGRVGASRLVLSGDSAVCRVPDGDELKPGRTDRSGSCIAGQSWAKYSQYQVLVDHTGLSRYEWRPWDMFSTLSVGTVAFNPQSYVSRCSVSAPHLPQVIGDLDFKRGLSGNIRALLGEDKVEYFINGEALVEIEPVGYQLDHLQVEERRQRLKGRKISLGTVRLERPAAEDDSSEDDTEGDWAEVSRELEYSQEIRRYWGHPAGTTRGLPSSAVLAGRNYTFPWGLKWEGREEGKVKVSAYLQKGTYVTADVKGVLLTREAPYSALLVQLYSDGNHTNHTLTSVLSYTAVDNVSIHLSAPRFIASDLPAPTTTTTTTTTSAPATPSTTRRPLPNGGMIDNLWPVGGDLDEDETDEDVGVWMSDWVGSTLFPPAPIPSTTVNPLRQFYPMDEDENAEEEAQRLGGHHSMAPPADLSAYPSASGPRSLAGVGLLCPLGAAQVLLAAAIHKLLLRFW